jgi:hypothetical protein
MHFHNSQRWILKVVMFFSVFESKIELLAEFLNFVKVSHPEKIHIVTPDIILNMSYLSLKKLDENTRALKHSNCFLITVSY